MFIKAPGSYIAGAAYGQELLTPYIHSDYLHQMKIVYLGRSLFTSPFLTPWILEGPKQLRTRQYLSKAYLKYLRLGLSLQ